MSNTVETEDYKFAFDPKNYKEDLIEYIKSNFGFESPKVTSFQGSDVLFQIDATDNVYIAKILTDREYNITNYLLSTVDGICASYLALPIEIKTDVKIGERMFRIMVSPVYGISEMSDNIRSNRVQKFKGEEAVFNQFIPGLKRLMLFRAAMGLYCVHQQGIVHADIKNDNYFGQDVLLGDFGLSSKDNLTRSEKVVNYETLPPFMYKTTRGQLIDYSKTNQLADIWGFGMMALQWNTSPETLSENRLFGFAWGEQSLTPETFLREYLINSKNWIPDSQLRNLITTIFEKTKSGTNTGFSMKDVILHPYFEELRKDKDYRYDYEVGSMYVSHGPSSLQKLPIRQNVSTQARVPSGKGVRRTSNSRIVQAVSTLNDSVNNFAQKKMIMNRKSPTKSEKDRVVKSVLRDAIRKKRGVNIPDLVEG